jgi:aromatic ring-cleaving dioxygenase
VLQNDIGSVLGKSLDYLLHPVYGCNFVDHQMWSLHKGGVPNNMAGIEDSGGWTGDAPPALDPLGPEALGAKCGCSNPQATSYDLHVLYDSSNNSAVVEKNELVSRLTSEFPMVRLIDDTPLSFLDKSSPFLAGQVHFQSDAPFAVVEWLADEQGSVDVLLVPQTCCGSLVDYTQHALWIGRPWPLNTAALAGKSGFLARALNAEEVVENDFVMYAVYASMNKWQSAATEKFVSAFASEFGLTRKGCTSSSDVEPAYDELCMMSETTSPGASDAMATAYAGVFVPKADASRVLSWVMTHRGADVNGYQVDLFLAPLTGKAQADFTNHALHIGTPWPVHELALK